MTIIWELYVPLYNKHELAIGFQNLIFPTDLHSMTKYFCVVLDFTDIIISECFGNWLLPLVMRLIMEQALMWWCFLPKQQWTMINDNLK